MTHPNITITLVPFETLSGSPEDVRLADGFVQDLIAEIARFPPLGVIAAASVFAAGRAGLDDAGIARRLGAGYLLKGSIRRSGKTMRISVQLLEAKSGRHLWAERYDTGDLLALQDEIAAKVANALAVRIDQSVLGAARRRQITGLETYECWLRGIECLQRGTLDSDAEGRRFSRSIRNTREPTAGCRSRTSTNGAVRRGISGRKRKGWPTNTRRRRRPSTRTTDRSSHPGTH